MAVPFVRQQMIGECFRERQAVLSAVLSCSQSFQVSFFEGTIQNLIASIEDGTFREGHFKNFFPAGSNCKFTHLWSTCTIFQLREKDRMRVFKDFASIATDKAMLVVDDAHCPNKVSCCCHFAPQHALIGLTSGDR